MMPSNLYRPVTYSIILNSKGWESNLWFDFTQKRNSWEKKKKYLQSQNITELYLLGIKTLHDQANLGKPEQADSL